MFPFLKNLRGLSETYASLRKREGQYWDSPPFQCAPCGSRDSQCWVSGTQPRIDLPRQVIKQRYDRSQAWPCKQTKPVYERFGTKNLHCTLVVSLNLRGRREGRSRDCIPSLYYALYVWIEKRFMVSIQHADVSSDMPSQVTSNRTSAGQSIARTHGSLSRHSRTLLTESR